MKTPDGRAAGVEIITGSTIGPNAPLGTRRHQSAATSSTAGHREETRGSEIDRQEALILGRVDAGRTRPDGLRKRDLRPFEGGLDVEIGHLERKPEAGHGIPVLLPGDGPVRVARIASRSRRDKDILDPSAIGTAENTAADDR